MSAQKKIIFLDRDGTINIDHGYVHRIEDWEFTSRAPKALAMLRAKGYGLALVSNQSGVGDGRFSEETVDKLHEHMQRKLMRESGVSVDAIAYCPHHRDGNCSCRKPKPGLAKQIEKLIGSIDYPNSWMVGDKESDILFGENIGTKTALIKSSYWDSYSSQVAPDVIFDSLYDFAKMISE